MGLGKGKTHTLAEEASNDVGLQPAELLLLLLQMRAFPSVGCQVAEGTAFLAPALTPIKHGREMSIDLAASCTQREARG